MNTEENARKEWAHSQAVASAEIEGYEPSPAFTADARDFRTGLISEDEFKARVLARAKAKGASGG